MSKNNVTMTLHRNTQVITKMNIMFFWWHSGSLHLHTTAETLVLPLAVMLSGQVSKQPGLAMSKVK